MASILPTGVVNVAQPAQTFGRIFRSEVPLWRAQHLVSNHELRDRGRAQQWRTKVSVKVPLRMLLVVGGPLVEAHRVGERGLEQVVVERRQLLENSGKRIALRVVLMMHIADVSHDQQEGLERPRCPKRLYCHEVSVLTHDTFATVQFELEIVAQQT